MKSLAARFLFTVAAILWLALVVVFYFVYHKPFELANVVGLANTLGDVLVAVLILAAGAAVGHRVLRAFEFGSALEALVMQAGLGLGMIGFFVFALGWIGLLHGLVFWGALGVVLVLLHRDVLASWRVLRSLKLARATRLEAWLGFYIVFVLAITLLFALMPPTGWDALNYHLTLPMRSLAQQRWIVSTDNVTFSYPALMEMLFTLALGLKSDTTGQVIHWLYLVLNVGLVVGWGARHFSWRVSWLAAALLLTVPSLLLISTWAYNDAALMFYTCAAFVVTMQARSSQRRRDFLLAGVLAGMALGQKYTAILVPLLLALLVVRPSRVAVGNALLLGITAVVLSFPWYLRNWLMVGNPIYPYVFNGENWDAFRSMWVTRAGTGLLAQPLALLLVPWTLTVQGSESGLFQATVGPLLLALVPFNLLWGHCITRTVLTRAMWFFVAGSYVVWLAGVAQTSLLWQTRYLFPVLPLLAILAAEGWERLSVLNLPQFSVQRFAGMVIAVVLGLNGLALVSSTLNVRPLDYVWGLRTRIQYLDQSLGAYYQTAQWANSNLPSSARIVFLWEPRTYYFEPAADGDAILDRWAYLNHLQGAPDGIAEMWRHAGYTHVLVFRAGLNDLLQSGQDPLTTEQLAALQALEARQLTLVYGTRALELTMQNSRPALTGADTAAYAIYEILPPH